MFHQYFGIFGILNFGNLNLQRFSHFLWNDDYWRSDYWLFLILLMIFLHAMLLRFRDGRVFLSGDTEIDSDTVTERRNGRSYKDLQDLQVNENATAAGRKGSCGFNASGGESGWGRDPSAAQSFSLLSRKSWILLIFSSCWSSRSKITPMGVFFSPTPSILFSTLFFMLRRRSEAWLRITAERETRRHDRHSAGNHSGSRGRNNNYNETLHFPKAAFSSLFTYQTSKQSK